MTRTCGDCTLCCKLMPISEIGKEAGVRCRHQRASIGCRVYATRTMPSSCRAWSCAWLTGADTGQRPDRAHAVVDIFPDFVTITAPDGSPQNIPVLQVWLDPGFPEAHRDPRLRAYLAECGEKGLAALIRFNSYDAFTLFPPAMSSDGKWHEIGGTIAPRVEHSLKEVNDVLASRGIEIEVKVEMA